jgi:hypothetical protein
MVLIQLAQDFITQWDVASLPDFWQSLPTHPHDWTVLAQTQLETDVFAGTRAWFDNFIKSGQVWALIIGIVFGYVLRGMTTYG